LTKPYFLTLRNCRTKHYIGFLALYQLETSSLYGFWKLQLYLKIPSELETHPLENIFLGKI